MGQNCAYITLFAIISNISDISFSLCFLDFNNHPISITIRSSLYFFDLLWQANSKTWLKASSCLCCFWGKFHYPSDNLRWWDNIQDRINIGRGLWSMQHLVLINNRCSLISVISFIIYRENKLFNGEINWEWYPGRKLKIGDEAVISYNAHSYHVGWAWGIAQSMFISLSYICLQITRVHSNRKGNICVHYLNITKL